MDGSHRHADQDEAEGGPDCGDDSSSGDADSLFSLASSSSSASPSPERTTYTLSPPPVPGLFFFPSLLPPALEDRLLEDIESEGYFSTAATGDDSVGGRDQAMLFGRSRRRPLRPKAVGEGEGEEKGEGEGREEGEWETGLPPWADSLVASLSGLLLAEADLPREVWELLFPRAVSPSRSGGPPSTSPDGPPSGLGEPPSPSVGPPSRSGEPPSARPPPPSRQLILNRYTAPSGITPHVDLPHRFGDGIILLSLGAGIGMRFRRDTHTHNLYLPRRSVLVLSGEARWAWEHGIDEEWGEWVAVRDGAEGGLLGLSQAEEEGEVGEEGGNGQTPTRRFVPRRTRTSITMRFLKEGADVVGW